MGEDKSYFIIQLGSDEYAVNMVEDPPAKIAIKPLALGDDDTRTVIVTETVDTDTEEVKHSVIMPDEVGDDEKDIWADCIIIASLVMANMGELLESGVFKEDDTE